MRRLFGRYVYLMSSVLIVASGCGDSDDDSSNNDDNAAPNASANADTNAAPNADTNTQTNGQTNGDTNGQTANADTDNCPDGTYFRENNGTCLDGCQTDNDCADGQTCDWPDRQAEPAGTCV